MRSDMTYFTPAEIAEALGNHPDTVRGYVRKGYLRAFVHRGRGRIKRILISEADLKKFLDEHYLVPFWPGRKEPKKESIKGGQNQ